jgi:hypothetical protein
MIPPRLIEIYQDESKFIETFVEIFDSLNLCVDVKHVFFVETLGLRVSTNIIIF